MPEYSYVNTRYGLQRVPSEEYGQVMENYWPETWRYMFRELLYDLGLN